MTRPMLALLLTALLTGSCFGQAHPSKHLSPTEQAHAIAANSPVEVKFADGSDQRGWISGVSDTGFILSHEKKRQMEKLPVTFVQIKAVKQIKNVKPGHMTRNVLIGVGIGLGVIVLGAFLDG